MTKKKYTGPAKDILDMIRKRNRSKEETPWYEKEPDREILRVTGQEDPIEKLYEDWPGETETPLDANAWQEFKRKFVETYGDEKIQPTGMTHSEYMEYIKTSGWREGDEYKVTIAQNKSDLRDYERYWTHADTRSSSDRLKEILRKLNDDEHKTTI